MFSVLPHRGVYYGSDKTLLFDCKTLKRHSVFCWSHLTPSADWLPTSTKPKLEVSHKPVSDSSDRSTWPYSLTHTHVSQSFWYNLVKEQIEGFTFNQCQHLQSVWSRVYLMCGATFQHSARSFAWRATQGSHVLVLRVSHARKSRGMFKYTPKLFHICGNHPLYGERNLPKPFYVAQLGWFLPSRITNNRSFPLVSATTHASCRWVDPVFSPAYQGQYSQGLHPVSTCGYEQDISRREWNSLFETSNISFSRFAEFFLWKNESGHLPHGITLSIPEVSKRKFLSPLTLQYILYQKFFVQSRNFFG